MIPISFTVREMADARGFRSQRQLAAKAGVDRATMSQLYRDQLKMISKATMAKLCKALECTPGDLMRVSSPVVAA